MNTHKVDLKPGDFEEIVGDYAEVIGANANAIATLISGLITAMGKDAAKGLVKECFREAVETAEKETRFASVKSIETRDRRKKTL